MAHRVIDLSYHKIQGGLGNVALSFIFDNSFFPPLYQNKAVLLHLISYDHVNATSAEAALT